VTAATMLAVDAAGPPSVSSRMTEEGVDPASTASHRRRRSLDAPSSSSPGTTGRLVRPLIPRMSSGEHRMAQRPDDAFPEYNGQFRMDRACRAVVSPYANGPCVKDPAVAHQRCEVLPDVVGLPRCTRACHGRRSDDCFDPTSIRSASGALNPAWRFAAARHGRRKNETGSKACSVGR